MRASEDDPKESKGLFLNPGSDEKDPTGLYIKPEFDDKNPEGRTGLNLDLGWRGKFGKTGQIVLRGASDEYVQRRNKAFQDSLRKSGIDPTGKILFIKG
ncbi:hypothetical protein [Prosthecobacter sp.]|uniref:hypothetical protein n=1 Tax=Prosthecobacter sp. TaxID=1965333 RepID=UPI003783844B